MAREAKRHRWIQSHMPQSMVKFSLSVPDNMYTGELLDKLKNEIMQSLKLKEVEMELEKDKGMTMEFGEFLKHVIHVIPNIYIRVNLLL